MRCGGWKGSLLERSDFLDVLQGNRYKAKPWLAWQFHKSAIWFWPWVQTIKVLLSVWWDSVYVPDLKKQKWRRALIKKLRINSEEKYFLSHEHSFARTILAVFIRWLIHTVSFAIKCKLQTSKIYGDLLLTSDSGLLAPSSSSLVWFIREMSGLSQDVFKGAALNKMWRF